MGKKRSTGFYVGIFAIAVIIISLGIYIGTQIIYPLKVAEKEIENLQNCDFTVRYHLYIPEETLKEGENGEDNPGVSSLTSVNDTLWKMLGMDISNGVLSGKKRGDNWQVKWYLEKTEQNITEIFIDSEEQKLNIKPVVEYAVLMLEEKTKIPLGKMIPNIKDCYISAEQMNEIFGLEQTDASSKLSFSDAYSTLDAKVLLFVKACEAPSDSVFIEELQEMKMYSLTNPENENQKICFGIHGKMPGTEDTVYLRIDDQKQMVEMMIDYQVKEAKDKMEMPDNSLTEDDIESIKEKINILKKWL